jgi:hypothetical protein
MAGIRSHLLNRLSAESCYVRRNPNFAAQIAFGNDQALAGELYFFPFLQKGVWTVLV